MDKINFEQNHSDKRPVSQWQPAMVTTDVTTCHVTSRRHDRGLVIVVVLIHRVGVAVTNPAAHEALNNPLGGHEGDVELDGTVDNARTDVAVSDNQVQLARFTYNIIFIY